MKITIQTVPHDQQRYETVGDWVYDGENLTITVSDMGYRRFNLLVGIHELIEAELCRLAGVDEATVTAFDVQYEADREKGLHAADSEPGDDRATPYRLQHAFATKIEKQLADALFVDWNTYDKTVQSL